MVCIESRKSIATSQPSAEKSESSGSPLPLPLLLPLLSFSHPKSATKIASPMDSTAYLVLNMIGVLDWLIKNDPRMPLVGIRRMNRPREFGRKRKKGCRGVGVGRSTSSRWKEHFLRFPFYFHRDCLRYPLRVYGVSLRCVVGNNA